MARSTPKRKAKIKAKPYAVTVDKLAPGRDRPRSAKANRVASISPFAQNILARLDEKRRDLDKPGYRRNTPVDLIDRRAALINSFVHAVRRSAHTKAGLRTFVYRMEDEAGIARQRSTDTYGRAHAGDSVAARENLINVQQLALEKGLRASAASGLYEEITGEPLPVREPKGSCMTLRDAMRVFGPILTR